MSSFQLRFILVLAVACSLTAEGLSATVVDDLSGVRSQVMAMEQKLLTGLKTKKQIRANLGRIQALLALQQKERALGKLRLAELEKTILSLESRRTFLQDRITNQKKAISGFLVAIEKPSVEKAEGSPLQKFFFLEEEERWEAPRQKLLTNLVDRGLKEMEALRADFTDSEKLEIKIQEEKQQLAYLFQDLNEQNSVLEMNRQFQMDLLNEKHDDKIIRLSHYRKLKDAEARVEHLMGEFNARVELERAVEAERTASRVMNQGVFEKLRNTSSNGKLPLPIVGGRVISSFGQVYDPKSRLNVFKKGIDIEGGKKATVRAIFPGKVAFAGALPGYGKVSIIHHGGHFYSLCGHLGTLGRKVGEAVAAGDAIGATDESGSPVYFEIRDRNIAVNPLQWVSN